MTRIGEPVEIINYKAKGEYCVYAKAILQNGETFNICATPYGEPYIGEKTPYDLFFADEEEVKSSLIKELEEYFKNTPKEQIEEDWKKIQDWYNQYCTDKSNDEEELTEFEKRIYNLINFSDQDNCPSIKEVKEEAEILLDLARKEIEATGWKDSMRKYKEAYEQGKQDALKDLPKWKRNKPNEKYIHNKEYYLTWNELEKLPKED